MRFHFNPRKAAQSAAFLVRQHDGKMDLYRLIKILYLSDRKALCERGAPITGDAMVSMPYGPVLSRIYDDSKSPGEIQNPAWRELLTECANNIVALKQEHPPEDELSEFERQVLKETDETYRHYSFSQLRKLVDGLPEYEDPQGSSLPIDPLKILREEGWSEEEIREAVMSARQEIFFKEISLRTGTRGSLDAAGRDVPRSRRLRHSPQRCYRSPRRGLYHSRSLHYVLWHGATPPARLSRANTPFLETNRLCVTIRLFSVKREMLSMRWSGLFTRNWILSRQSC